jgi:formylglycine-generating enzyme required for sulfatase activity
MTRTARCLLLPALLCLLCAGLALWPEAGQSAPAPLSKKHFTNTLSMKLVRIAKGKFLMGSPPSEVGRWATEHQHEVEITRGFFISTHHVTQAQYQKVMGTNPSHFRAGGAGAAFVRGLDTRDFPAENMPWNDALTFCKKLSALPGEKGARRVYRLPTEAEWEYACRAGTTTPFAFGKTLSSTQANFNGNQPYGGAARGPYLQRPSKVGSYKPNAWGLYDMHGNVYHFCSDWYGENYYRVSPRKDPVGPKTGTTRVVRGASWINDGMWCRSAFRIQVPPNDGRHHIGFRVVCDLGGRR